MNNRIRELGNLEEEISYVIDDLTAIRKTIQILMRDGEKEE